MYGPHDAEGLCVPPPPLLLPFFNLPLEVVIIFIIIIIIIINNNDNWAACPRRACGSPVLQHPARGMGAGSGALPQAGKADPSSAAPHACHGRARGWSRGTGSWAWYRRSWAWYRGKNGAISPPVPPPCPASRGCSRRHLRPPASKTDRLPPGAWKSPCRADPSRDKWQQGTLLVFYINSRALGDKRPN